MKGALRSGGIICSQGSGIYVDLKHVKHTVEGCRLHFKNTRYATIFMPSYPCGSIGFVIGCLDDERKLDEPLHRYSDKEVDELGFKYYTSNVHSATFVLPRFAEKALNF